MTKRQATHPARSIALRNLAVAVVLVLIGWLVARTWVARSAVIVSESMAPALLGPHLVATCPACGQTTNVGIAEDTRRNLEAGRSVACQNCGTLISLPTDSPVRSGESLLVFRNSAFVGQLARWDLIACRDPMSPETIIVKRLIGLPGETIQIVGGDIFIDGQVACKSLDQQASTAILVYDAAHETEKSSADQAASGVLRRWVPSQEGSCWSVKDGHFRYNKSVAKEAGKEGMSQGDRLTYHHWHRVDGRMVAGPVMDQLAYNQWFPIRRDRFHAVPDLMLTFHASRIAGDGLLKVFTADDQYVVTFDYTGRKVTVRSLAPSFSKEAEGGTTNADIKASDRQTIPLLVEAPFNPPPGNNPVPMLISTVDRCLMVVVDRDVVIRQPLPESVACSSTPFSLEAVGLDLDLTRVRFYRDTYYAEPAMMSARWKLEEPIHLGEDEYFVLGDNSCVSEDSRTWSCGPGISRSEIFGRPW